MAESAAKLIPAARASSEIRVSNSRFLAQVAPATSVAEARALIAEIRAAYPAANHHVYAYLIGHGATTTQGMSDDGEPAGTAGRPLLAVLRGSGLGDAVLVVSRYFGGTLLGTGGLVRAYSDAAKAVLAAVERVEKIAWEQLVVVLPYAAYQQARRIIAAHGGEIVTEAFAADVQLVVRLPAAHTANFAADLRAATGVQVV